MSPDPRTQALEALIEAHATELKLPTVRRRFRALADEALREHQTPLAYLAALLEAEHPERAERRERRRLIDARASRWSSAWTSSASTTTPKSRRPPSPLAEQPFTSRGSPGLGSCAACATNADAPVTRLNHRGESRG